MTFAQPALQSGVVGTVCWRWRVFDLAPIAVSFGMRPTSPRAPTPRALLRVSVRADQSGLLKLVWDGVALSGMIVVMSGKGSKPPIDKKSVQARLEHAQERRLLVHVRRWIPDADRIEGFVVGIGKKWVVFQRLSDRVAFDGWVLLRQKDIQAVSIDPDADCFEVKALKARSLWPPSAPDLSLDDAVGMLTSAGAASTMVSVFDEFDRPSVCWIGAVSAVEALKVKLLEVNTRGGWARKPRTFDPRDITRIDLGGGYEEALMLVAGPPPAVS